MSEDLLLAFQVLLVGMVTVAVVLILVVWMGRSMIYLINLIPATSKPITSTPRMQEESEVKRHHLVAISAAVTALSDGKATVTKIEKKH